VRVLVLYQCWGGRGVGGPGLARHFRVIGGCRAINAKGKSAGGKAEGIGVTGGVASIKTE